MVVSSGSWRLLKATPRCASVVRTSGKCRKRAPQTVKLPDHRHIPSPQLRQQVAPDGALDCGPTAHFFIHCRAPGLTQRLHLQRELLVLRTHPRLPKVHPAPWQSLEYRLDFLGKNPTRLSCFGGDQACCANTNGNRFDKLTQRCLYEEIRSNLIPWWTSNEKCFIVLRSNCRTCLEPRLWLLLVQAGRRKLPACT